MIGLFLLWAQVPMMGKVDLHFSLKKIGAAGEFDLSSKVGKKGTVLFFLNEQCGVTYYYRSRVAKIQKEFEPQGFVFTGVRTGKKLHPMDPVELPEVKTLRMTFVDDEKGRLRRMFKVEQSMVFAVLDSQMRLRFLGGLDDKVTETQVQHRYLRDALVALSAGKPVKVATAPAIGCAILPEDGP